eukprot:CAMPEP_0114290368 /NCGR_PEP_ID=MMETSP0059-20121206/7896_1 /TAXON_ID=36894 /ORGANISM="Pyramimonas parkeae, Strain CCMP726" /LENGTH=486 /DNA_ID=CAMNT_0001411755 /DNA_START=348 /DNA_END=1808 /DNA_ORIENTATION=-
MPSWVHFSKSGRVRVGRKAQQLQHRDPLNTFHSAKRFIGRKTDVVARDMESVAFGVCQDEEGLAMMECPALDTALYPEEVSTEVLRKILQDVEQALGESVRKAVITVPAYFNDAQRDATTRAGLAAGLEKVKLLREPQAAALAYGVNRDADSTVMVFDLGGGTFDVAVLDVGGGAVEVLATGGDAYLGGNDLDKSVMEWLVKEAKKQGVKIPVGNAKALSSLLSLSRNAREALSDSEEHTITIPTAGNQPNIEVRFTRQTLEKLTGDILRQMRLPMEQCAFQCGVDLASQGDEYQRSKRQGRKAVRLRRTNRNIDTVLLVGGATRMPAVRRFVQNMTNILPVLTAVNPDEAVALGAAVQAGVLEGIIEQGEVVDVWQASLMRALAEKQLRESENLQEKFLGNSTTDNDSVDSEDESWEDWDDDEVEYEEISEAEWMAMQSRGEIDLEDGVSSVDPDLPLSRTQLRPNANVDDSLEEERENVEISKK